MGSLIDEEESPFFDAPEEIASISGSSNSDNDENLDYSYCYYSNNYVLNSFQYDVWVSSPKSVSERRSKFLKSMGMANLDRISEGEFDRLTENSGAVLRVSGMNEELSSILGWSSDEFEFSRENDGFMVRDGNTSDGSSDSLPSFSPKVDSGDVEKPRNYNSDGMLRKVRKGWLSRLRSITCAVDKRGEIKKSRSDEDDENSWNRARRVRVRQCKKRSKEFSGLYMGQDIQAHEGPILAMKFSPDGKYLASAGEDGVVRVWQVVEDERCDEVDIPEIDPSCIYFSVNQFSELEPLFFDKEKVGTTRSLRKTPDSACVILPQKVFRIVEKPLHEFYGHSDEVLDLSWSNNNFLLSCSVDKTVRLWQVGTDRCLRVFVHSNYVTCIQFNPVDDNYFISGSIDGKVRIWDIPGCQVVDWADIRDIVTAVCYRPDGQGGIVGSMMGNCRFYSMSGHHLQLDAEICLNSKKKSPYKKITGFEFYLQDSSKVMVSCSDSQVRILQGLKVIGKYKGVRSAGNQLSACFTSDGKHIVSACKDSNVYVWNCINNEEPTHNRPKKVKSWERFSTNASIAIPWSGFRNSEKEYPFQIYDDSTSLGISPLLSPNFFSLSQEYFSDYIPKGSATWPEEKLPALSPSLSVNAMHKSQYKFLKSSCQFTSSSHSWGLVIVTAGWDGRIRSFHNYGLPVPV